MAVRLAETPDDAGPAGDRHRPGRPRSEACDRAIEAAALDLLVDEGFGRMTIEGIASRAGVGKATVYRRWDSKEHLVVDAVSHRCAAQVGTPDTGSLRSDMIELLDGVTGRFRRDGRVMQAFAAEQGRHPQLAEMFRTMFLAERRAAARAIVARAVERGELPPGSDTELLADLGPALLWHRLTVTGAPLDDGLPERIVDQFFPGRAGGRDLPGAGGPAGPAR